MSFNRLKQKLIIIVLPYIVIGCISESAESLFPTNDIEANSLYEARLKSVIESKCISCHTYHLEGSNRYDNFEKTKSSISQILERINANSNISMPPDGSPQLTVEEKQLFQEFLDILNSEVGAEESMIKLTWTAYKYADFEERGGVSGTFDKIEYRLNEEYEESIDILKNAEVNINTSSVNIDGMDGMRTMNVGRHFFLFFTPTIVGKVISYTTEEALINFTMNENNQDVRFDVTIKDNKLILKGIILDMNFFNWKDAYEELETVCGEFHENKVWPDIDLEVEIPIID